MPFMNAFASDEDVEKYDLNGLWDKYRPLRKEKFNMGHGMFTVDRERNIFFMTIGWGGEESWTPTVGQGSGPDK